MLQVQSENGSYDQYFCEYNWPPPQLSVETTKLKLYFVTNDNSKNHKGFEIRYEIQSDEDDDTGVYMCLLVVFTSESFHNKVES